MSAGFLFSLNSSDTSASTLEIVSDCVNRGMYATLVNSRWGLAVASTLGDFIAMTPGDNVYFFSKRTVFGIGEIVDVFNSGDAAFELFKGATSTKRITNQIGHANSTDSAKGKIERWAIVFRPSPYFFVDGIDMDDLLRSDPEAFKSLRTFQNRSFIQFDDKENNAFKSAILRRNESILLDPQKASGNTIACNYRDTVSKLLSHAPINNEGPQPIDLTTLIREEAVNGALKKEMTVEVALLNALQHKEPQAASIFGTWDYLSHQVTSSPFKPIIYMDKIDVFGYRWIPGYEGHIISKYLVVEIKKDEAKLDDRLPSKDYEQLMKYVDWVCNQYAHGDYTMIEAYLVANSFDFSNCSLMKQAITRSFVTGHDAKTTIWDNLLCVQYHAAPNGTISFSRA